MVLVVGATGLLGSRICRALVRDGHHLRALVRDGSPGRGSLRALGLETVIGDLRDSASLAHACHDVTAVITTANAVISRRSGDSIAAVDRNGQLALLRSARAAGVEQFVYLSVSPTVRADNPFIQAKRQLEDAVRTSGMAWTIVQPTAFMEVHLGAPLGWDYKKGRARVLGSAALVKSYISADDVAKFSARCVVLPSARNRTLHVAGPEPLSAADAVTIAQEVTGRTFSVQRIPTAVLRALSVLLRPFSPGASSLMSMAVASVPDVVDMKPLAAEFGIALTPYCDYVRRELGSSIE